ncbi:MAG: hypothetical protein GY847_12855 [Proteobacteria bacterium]|nr:hypothetical protein [Pseudomonadota bacterium]
MSEIAYSFDSEMGIVTLVIDTPGPINLIGPRFIVELEKAIEQMERDSVRGVLITSGKKRSFLDGMNLTEIVAGGSAQEIRSIMCRYQTALSTLAKAQLPVVAALDNQSALGGGFEMLLWAADRVFATPNSKMGLPEVNVGLFPAGGGTQTLPRVVGFEAAVEMITAGRTVSAEKLAETSLVTIGSSKTIRAEAIEWLATNKGVINRNYSPNYQWPTSPSAADKQNVIDKARTRFTICPLKPYYRAAIDALANGINLSFEEAVKKEVDLFVPLFANENVRAKIDLFFLISTIGPKLVKIDAKQTVKVKKIAVIGAGLMGQSIAQVAADKGFEVILLDIDAKTAEAGVQKIEDTLEYMVEKGRWSPDRKERAVTNISWTSSYEALRDTPLIIESVFEDLSVKKKVLRQVQEINPEGIFASNTSSLPMAEISEGAIRPDQVVGMHFFSPVPLMPLLEVIEGKRSNRNAMTTAVAAGRAMGKTVIRVGDGPGFYTSRTFGSYILSGFRLAELGLSPWDVDRIALEAGFSQGPLHVYGTAGGNIIYHACKFMVSRFSDRLVMPKSFKNVIEGGYVGAGGPSFYKDERRMTPNETILTHIESAKGLPTPSREEAADYLTLSMVNEAFWSLSEGVVKDYFSMDLGAVLGLGFPDCWGGPARYVSLKGVRATKERLEELADKFKTRALIPAPEFAALIACGVDSNLI